MIHSIGARMGQGRHGMNGLGKEMHDPDLRTGAVNPESRHVSRTWVMWGEQGQGLRNRYGQPERRSVPPHRAGHRLGSPPSPQHTQGSGIWDRGGRPRRRKLTWALLIICTNHLHYDLPCELQEFSTHPGLLLVPKMPCLAPAPQRPA